MSMVYNPFLSGGQMNLPLGFGGGPYRPTAFGGGFGTATQRTASVQPRDPWQSLLEQAQTWTPETRPSLESYSPWTGKGLLANAYASWGPIAGLGVEPGLYTNLANQTRNALWEDYKNQLAAGREGLVNPDVAAIQYWMNDPFGYSNASQNIAGIQRGIQERYYNQDPLLQAREGARWAPPEGYADFESALGGQQAQLVSGVLESQKKTPFLKKWGAPLLGLATLPFGGPAALGAALGLEGTAAGIAGGLLTGAGGSALSGGNPLVGALTGGLTGGLGASGAFGELARSIGLDALPFSVGEGADFVGPPIPTELAGSSPLTQFAAAQGLTDVPLGSATDPFNMSAPSVDFYPGAGSMVSSGSYPASTSSLVNPLAEWGLSPRTGIPVSFASEMAQGLSPGALASLAQLSPYSLGSRAATGLGGDIPMTPDPKGASMSRKFMEGLGIPPEWLDTLGSGVEFVTQDPLGRSLAAGTLAYLSNKAQQSQAEEMNRQAAAEAAARRQQFDSSGPVVRGGTRRSYLGGPGSYSRYGMGPEHKFWGEEPVPAARGGPLSRLAQGEGGGQGDKIPALLSEGEYVIPSDVVSDLGDGSNAEGARRLDRLRSGVRKHKGRRKGLPPRARAPEQYMKG